MEREKRKELKELEEQKGWEGREEAQDIDGKMYYSITTKLCRAQEMRI